MAELRTITYTITDSLIITPTATQEAGVRGDDKATLVRFHLPEALSTGYTLRLMMEDGRGGVDTTDPLTVQGSPEKYVEYTIPLAWTQHGGEIALRLMVYVSDGQNITQAAYTFEGRLRFRDKTTFVQKIGTHLEDTLLEVLERVDEAQIAASNAIGACGAASDSAVEAAQSANVAEGHKTAAQAAQMAAESAADTASAQATQAKASAEEAASAKASAESARTAADSAKTAAAGSASAAASSAASAASSAETAATAATNAAASETAAETAKAGAETAAASASTDAGNAASAAKAASGHANTAYTAAATATEKAADAADSAASMHMKLIRKITTTEAITSVTISTDEEGNAISLDRFCLFLSLPNAVSVSSGGMVIQCNGGTASSYYAYYHTDTVSVKHARFDGECMGDTTGADGAVRQWAINYALGSANSYGNTLKTSRYMPVVPTINKLKFSMALPSGAVLVLYGRSGG